MKKLFSILFAVMILLSGMHLSLATHLCGGEVSAVKLSFSHQKAGCGMCSAEQTFPKGISAESCCKVEMSFFAIDSNYNPSTIQINEPVTHLLQAFYIPAVIGNQFFNTISASNTNVRPPGKFLVSAVSLTDICVFRI